jgi:hypothetical protein
VAKMDGNTLHYLLSHLGEGSWQTFARAVAELAIDEARNEDEMRSLIRSTRFRLSDTGSVDFIADKRRRWQVLPPVFASFPENGDRAVLCGGRSPGLVALLNKSAEQLGCTVAAKQRRQLPDEIVVSGESSAIDAVAAACGVRRSPDYGEELIESFVTIEKHLANAPAGELMINWERRYFDLQSRRWTTNTLSHTVCECTSRYGRSITLVQISRTRMVVLPRREAIYGAAALSGVPIVFYDQDHSLLKVPMHAPLPDACARLACISSGSVGTLNDGFVCYENVPPRLAKIIFASVGQRLN